ncbi:hypothetical protein ABZ897_15625 [Nonomuraea sp. NPDC046802]|uniref:hypothetical protein n=1 Tax=Nonomuraea sp. NPDC046802 TaxID=3154919 RepID=UPI0033EB9453
MARRERTVTLPCAEGGCRQYSLRAYRSQAEYAEIMARQAKHPFECSRHSDRHEVLRPDNIERTHMLVASKITTRHGRVLDGLYWLPEGAEHGGSGIVSGPGFRAHARDVPEGTRLIVTARLELPTTDTPGETTADV